MIVFIHVPKTGGSTLNSLARERGGLITNAA